MIVKKKVGEMPSTDLLKSVMKKTKGATPKYDVPKVSLEDNVRRIIEKFKSDNVLGILDINPFSKVDEEAYSMYGSFIRPTINVKTGFSEDKLDPEKVTLEDVYSNDICDLIMYYDVDARLEKAFVTVYLMNVPVIAYYAVRTLLETVLKVADVNDLESTRTSIFVRMIQDMSMLGMLSSMKETIDFQFGIDPNDAIMNDQIFDFMDDISDSRIDPRLIQKLLANGIRWDTIQAVMDTTRTICNEGDVISNSSAELFTRIAIAAVKLIDNVDDDQKDVYEAVNTALVFISHELTASAEYVSRMSVATYQSATFVVALVGLCNEVRAGEELINAFHGILSNVSDDTTVFADYLRWVDMVRLALIARPDEINAATKELGYDVFSHLTSVSYFMFVRSMSSYESFVDKASNVILYMPVQMCSILMRHFSIIRVHDVFTSLEMLRNASYTLASLSFMGQKGKMTPKEVSELDPKDIDSVWISATAINNNDIPYTFDITNTEKVAQLCIEAEMIHSADVFEGQMLF